MSRLVATSIGVLLGICLFSLSLAIRPHAGTPWPLWYSAFQTIAEALLAVVPGFVAGWLFGRSGLSVGAGVGVLLSVTSLAIVWLWWGAMPSDAAAAAVVFGGIANIITQSVAGAGGELVRSRTLPPPNSSFKPKPLRGSA